MYLSNDGHAHPDFKYDPSDELNQQLAKGAASHAGFLDIGEDGQLDVLAIEGSSTRALLWYSTSDTYFMKATVGNGVDTTSMGGNGVGATVQCIVTSLD